MHGQSTRFVRTVSGRCDLVVCTGAASQGPSRGTCVVGIEVKPPSSWSGAQREAVVQLVGLNVANACHSPSVVLTNLSDKHEVYFINRVSTDPVRYELRYRSFAQFGAAVAFAVFERTLNTDESADFGRGDTPPSSVAEAADELAERSPAKSDSSGTAAS